MGRKLRGLHQSQSPATDLSMLSNQGRSVRTLLANLNAIITDFFVVKLHYSYLFLKV